MDKWANHELLISVAGHLKGHTHQEQRNLMTDDCKTNFMNSMTAPRGRLDPGHRATAEQDLCHTSQEENENVSDFIQRLERTFRKGYGHDAVLPETKDALLYNQLEQGLR